MPSSRGVSGFWLDIKALESARTHLIGELGPKEGMLVYAVWVRLFTWQYQSAAPVKDAAHLARLTNIHIHKAKLLWQLLPQLLPRSLCQSPHGLLCQRTMRTLENYDSKQQLMGAAVAPKKAQDSYSYSDKSKREEKLSTEAVDSKKKVARARFQKPTAEEVQVYLGEQGITDFTGEEFWDANEAKGWRVGRTQTPMKCWKATVRTWNRNRGTGYGKRETAVERSERKLKEWVERRQAGEILDGDEGTVRAEVVPIVRG